MINEQKQKYTKEYYKIYYAEKKLNNRNNYKSE